MFATLLALVLSAPAPGLYFEQTTALVAGDGASAQGVRSRVWCAGRRMRLEAGGPAGGPALVLRLDEGRALRLDPEARVATELDAARLRARSASDAAVAAGLMGGLGEERLRTAALPQRAHDRRPRLPGLPDQRAAPSWSRRWVARRRPGARRRLRRLP